MEKLNWLSTLSEVEGQTVTIQFWDELSKTAYPVSKGTMRIPISLEPFTVSTEQYTQIEARVALLISAARKLVEAYFEDTQLQTLLAVDPLERSLIMSSKNESLTGVVRLDLVYSDGPKVLEINADFPDGLFMHDVTSSAIAKLSHVPPGRQHAELFVDLVREHAVPQDGLIYIGYEQGRTFVDEFELCRAALLSAGWQRVHAGPLEALHRRDDGLYYEGQRIVLLRRGTELSKLRKNTNLLTSLEDAQRSGLRVVNNFKMRLLGHKTLLAALQDTRFAHYLTSDEQEAIRALVPKTYKLTDVAVDTIVGEKDQWVLKPADLAEGTGVVLGSAVSVEEWRRVLDEAAYNKDGWILQEKVSIPKAEFTYFDEHGRRSISAYYDLDPHVFLFKDKNIVGKFLVRFSNEEVLNVMKGGGITYAFETKRA